MLTLRIFLALVLVGHFADARQVLQREATRRAKKQVVSYKESVPPSVRWKASEHAVTVGMSRDGLTFLTMDEVTGGLSSWRVTDGAKGASLLAHTVRKGHSFAVISSDDKLGASVGDDKIVVIWDVASLAKLAEVNAGAPHAEMSFALPSPI